MLPITARTVLTSFTSSIVGAVFLLACSSSSTGTGGSGSAGSGPTPQAFCTDYCAHVTTCDKTQNAQTCTDSCGNELAVLLPKMRGDVVTSMQSCIGSTDCVDLLTTSAVGNCEDEAAASVAVSTEGSSFCTAWSSSAAKCGMSLDSKTGCLNAVKVYTDDAITEAGACLASACDQISACVNASFGVDEDAGTTTSAEPIHAGRVPQAVARPFAGALTTRAVHPVNSAPRPDIAGALLAN